MPDEEVEWCWAAEVASATGRSPASGLQRGRLQVLGVTSQGAGAALKDIEILTDKNGGLLYSSTNA